MMANFGIVKQDWISSGHLPATLVDFLTYILSDWSPEVTAGTHFYNQWIMDNPNLPSGAFPSVMPEAKVHTSLGNIRYKLRGVEVERTCSPHTLWHFHKVAEEVRGLEGGDADAFDRILSQTGGSEFMLLKLSRCMHRENNVLALG